MGFLKNNEKIRRKLHTQLKMSVHRINLLKNKKTNSIKVQKRQVAQLLKQDKNESARIKVENIIRDDYCLEAYDILMLFSELLLSRLQLLAESKDCPFDLKEAVSTLIYSAPRIDIPELTEVRKLFAQKFGKKFVQECMENKTLSVNQRVIFKLGLQVPKPYLCVQYLKKIAEANGIEWEDDIEEEAKELDMNPEMDYTKDTRGTGYETHGFQQTVNHPQQNIQPNLYPHPRQNVPPPYPQQEVQQNMFSSIPAPIQPHMNNPMNQVNPMNQQMNNPMNQQNNQGPTYGQTPFNDGIMPSFDQFSEPKADKPQFQSTSLQIDDEEDELSKKLQQLKTGESSDEDEFDAYNGSVNSGFNLPDSSDQFNLPKNEPPQNTFSTQPSTIEQPKPSANKVEYDFDLLQQRFNQLKNK